ncbi:MAG: hypothetical protein CPDRYMAC_6016 [uncultured Paraburkholderia sp.]|nr:MAG: hypothetical protein CPDRYDRY_5912 [uncultured Paraburkholderia sp.]CAH2943314.1 MAG: hypothetical protein CPDRYMAC_6016 [uncultured Paraburkholderia sp.]
MTRWVRVMMPAAMVSIGYSASYEVAYAQSSVTLYGVVDESVRYLTHVNAACAPIRSAR